MRPLSCAWFTVWPICLVTIFVTYLLTISFYVNDHFTNICLENFTHFWAIHEQPQLHDDDNNKTIFEGICVIDGKLGVIKWNLKIAQKQALYA